MPENAQRNGRCGASLRKLGFLPRLRKYSFDLMSMLDVLIYQPPIPLQDVSNITQ